MTWQVDVFRLCNKGISIQERKRKLNMKQTDIIHEYISNVIAPIEAKRNELRRSVLSKKFWRSKSEKELLEKYDKLLLKRYIFLEKLFDEL